MKVLNKSFNIISVVFVLLTILTLASCGSGPEPINYGHDECEFCRMLITDNKYGAELVTDKGKIYKFDSIECMIEFSLVKNTLGDTNNKLLITDFYNPGNLVDARNSFYVKNDKFRSPMGLNVTAFNSEEQAQKFISENGGEKLSWVEVIELVKQRSM
jgi:copper chaperone NosL